ncbi:MAG: hypothetical protein A2216_05020 [Omnitrophica WOR_2 bacterium RIFOXYA2_FULL_45_12]|nr:MAG: hypothetical protein A2216_05020 [Omnitrophica WOR_2 bacterium RIFOXYA2_FULL_45_12]HBU07761.1 DUF433 domain-containing protein [Candidatus Omnitrophota bacterium]
MVVATEHPYVIKNKKIIGGEPVIKGTRTPIRAIAEWWKFGAAPEEIKENLPHLTLAQIFDALSYYDDHRKEIEAYITRNNNLPVNGINENIKY